VLDAQLLELHVQAILDKVVGFGIEAVGLRV